MRVVGSRDIGLGLLSMYLALTITPPRMQVKCTNAPFFLKKNPNYAFFSPSRPNIIDNRSKLILRLRRSLDKSLGSSSPSSPGRNPDPGVALRGVDSPRTDILFGRLKKALRGRAVEPVPALPGARVSGRSDWDWEANSDSDCFLDWKSPCTYTLQN